MKKAEHQWIDAFEQKVPKKILESPLDCKEIQPVNPKRNWSWIFLGTTDAEAAILWPLDVKSLLIGKDPDAGKDWKQEEKGVKEDEMIWWHHWLNGHEWKTLMSIECDIVMVRDMETWHMQSIGLQRVGHNWAT